MALLDTISGDEYIKCELFPYTLLQGHFKTPTSLAVSSETLCLLEAADARLIFGRRYSDETGNAS